VIGPAPDTGLKVLLATAIIVPALVFRFATYHGDVVAVLYREPKKDAISVLCWLVVIAFVLVKGRKFDLRRLSDLTTDPCMISLSLLLLYFGLTRLWVTVPVNWSYEMSQYALLYLLLMVMLAWARIDPTIPKLVRTALIVGAGLVAGVGVVQGLFPNIAPPPINPFSEVANPSLMGYKNPAALSILGQIFILAGAAFSPRKPSTAFRCLLLILLALELAYLVSLQSRTSLISLAVGVVVLTVLWPRNRRGSFRRTIAALGVGLVIVIAVLTANPKAMNKAASILHYATNPAAYLESDRGIYLLNTLNMVNHRPFGVGIGDWQTMYPVFRKVNPDTAFNDRFQVRRAHSDHVQILGEGGWPGLILWLGFLAIVVLRTAFRAARSMDRRAAFMTAQLVAVSAAMCTDFFTEIPYNKFQFILLVFLAIDSTRPPRPAEGSEHRRTQGFWVLTTTLVAAAALGGIVAAIENEKKLIGSATSTALFLEAARSGPESLGSADLFEDATRIADDWSARSGHWKSSYRDHLALARSAAFTGRDRLARRQAFESVRLHPFNPQGLRLMADLSDDPIEASLWQNAARHVEDTPGNGFRIYHPLGDRYSDVAH